MRYAIVTGSADQVIARYPTQTAAALDARAANAQHKALTGRPIDRYRVVELPT